MRIMYINNAGGGFANYMNVEEGMSIEKLFKQKMPHEEIVNRFLRIISLRKTTG